MCSSRREQNNAFTTTHSHSHPFLLSVCIFLSSPPLPLSLFSFSVSFELSFFSPFSFFRNFSLLPHTHRRHSSPKRCSRASRFSPGTAFSSAPIQQRPTDGSSTSSKPTTAAARAAGARLETPNMELQQSLKTSSPERLLNPASYLAISLPVPFSGRGMLARDASWGCLARDGGQQPLACDASSNTLNKRDSLTGKKLLPRYKKHTSPFKSSNHTISHSPYHHHTLKVLVQSRTLWSGSGVNPPPWDIYTTQTPADVSCDERDHRHPDRSPSPSVLLEVSRSTPGSLGQLSGGLALDTEELRGPSIKMAAALPLCSRFTEQKHLFVCPDRNSHSYFLDPNPDMVLYNVDLIAKAFPETRLFVK